MPGAIGPDGSGGPAHVAEETADASGGVGYLDSAHGRGRTGGAAERAGGSFCSPPDRGSHRCWGEAAVSRTGRPLSRTRLQSTVWRPPRVSALGYSSRADPGAVFAVCQCGVVAL